jgi:hypothetical protein
MGLLALLWRLREVSAGARGLDTSCDQGVPCTLDCRCACLHRDVSMASSCVCSPSSPTSKPTITLQLLVTRHTRRSFAIAAASSSTATGAPSVWHVLRLWRCVAPPPQLVATSLPLAACRPHTSSPMTIPGPTIGRVARVALLS